MLTKEDDYRVEALIASWLENGNYLPENITIMPRGTFLRSFSKDILEIEKSSRQENAFALHVSREGLYDMLPEGLFHEAVKKVRKTTEESAEESKRYQQEEKAARKFFLPLEQEFYRGKIWVEYAELQECLSGLNSESSMLIDFWGLNVRLYSTAQLNFMVSILPDIHRIAGNLNMVRECLEIILQEKVEIKSSLSSSKKRAYDTSLLGLGEISLGTDAILKEELGSEEPLTEVLIGPIAPEKVFSYLPGERTDQMLSNLYGFLFPIENEVVTSVLCSESEALSGEKEKGPRLGFSAFI